MPVLLVVLLIFGVALYISHVVKYLNSGNAKDLINKMQAVSKTSTVVDCCLTMKSGYRAGLPKGWKENFCDILPLEICVQVTERFRDKLYDYIDARNDELNIKNMNRDIEIRFSVEYKDDKLIDIKGLDKFQTDLNNNAYSTTECSNLIQVLTELSWQ